MQISEKFKGRTIWVKNIEYPIDRCFEGILCSGSSGSGKTLTHINPIALGFAAYPINPDQKSAIFYQNIKGTGALELEKKITCLRTKDVRIVDRGGKLGISLFNRSSYPDLDSCANEVGGFLEELLLQSTDSFGSTGKDTQFWTTQRMNIISVLSRLSLPIKKEQTSIIREMTHPSHLVATAYRMRYFFQYISLLKRMGVEEKTGHLNSRPPSLKTELRRLIYSSGLSLQDLEDANIRVEPVMPFAIGDPEELEDFYFKNLGHYTAQRYLNSIEEVDVKENNISILKHEPLYQLFDRLDNASREALERLIQQYRDLTDVTYSCVESDLKGLIQTILEGPLKKILLAPKTVSLEEVIHKGLILIIDFPGAIAGPERIAMLAIKLALRTKILQRLTLLFEGEALNTERPILWVLDEGHSLVVRGNNDDSLFLSQCREVACCMLFGVQNLSLLASSIRDPMRFESFLGNMKNRIICGNSDQLTNHVSSVFVGNKRGSVSETLWQSNAYLERLLKESGSTEVSCVEPNQFLRLATGQAYVVLATGKTLYLDARNHLPEPIVRALVDPEQP